MARLAEALQAAAHVARRLRPAVVRGMLPAVAMPGIFSAAVFGLCMITFGAGARFATGWDASQDHVSSSISRASVPNAGGDQLKKPCDPGSDNRNSELCAQWKAADAAQISADSARETTLIGWLALLVGAATLASAIAAAAFARKAAMHTAEANLLAVSAQRAWIKLSASLVAFEMRNGAVYFEFHVKKRNIGPTMATDVSSFTMASVRGARFIDAIQAEIDQAVTIWPYHANQPIIPGDEVIGQTRTSPNQPQPIKDAPPFNIRIPKIRVILYTIVRYRISGDSEWHYSAACWGVTPKDRSYRNAGPAIPIDRDYSIDDVKLVRYGPSKTT